MLFETKDEKVRKLERKIYEMERRMDHNFQRMNQSITTLREVIIHLQQENTQLRGERDFLIERHKKMLKRVPVPDLAYEINEKLVKPVAGKIKENADFVQLLAKEGFVEIKEQPAAKKEEKNPAKELKDHIVNTPAKNHGKSIDSLFELVSNAGKMRADAAARKMNVHEIQIEEWAKILENHDLVTLKKTQFGKMEISKV